MKIIYPFIPLMFTLLKFICQSPLLRPTKEDYATLRSFISRCIEEGAPLHNAFQHNRIEMALHAIQLAHESIGLKGLELKAYLLHCILDTSTQREMASTTFGAEIGAMLDRFNNISTLLLRSDMFKEENFRNLFVHQAGDMRIVLILIAESVVLMRHAKDAENLDAQLALSREAAYLYAPLAHKLGLYQLKRELEDLSLKYMEREAYYHIKDCLNATKESREAYIEEFINPIRQLLDEEGLNYHIKGRTKSIHSIWQKMKKQQCGFHGVYDLFAIRIILDAPYEKEKEQCWKVFSLVTAKYESSLKRLRDWLTVPKSNGYESLHITVRGPQDKWVEVQIRTERMDEIAEHGLAAHWRYKGVKASGNGMESWLANIRTALETGNDQLLTDNLAVNGKQDVYVFSPKGDLYKLGAGATLIDFAYHIHSRVGDHCVGGRINGKAVPIRHQLESGTTVEVLTQNSQMPKLEWLNFAATAHARAKIKASVRDLQAKEAIMARELLERKLKNKKLDWDESVINILIKKLGFKEASDFYKSLTDGRSDVNEVLERYVEITKREAGQLERTTPLRRADEFNLIQDIETKRSETDTDVLIIDKNLKGIDFQMARCCSPVYGDEVFGFVNSGGGIKIHRHNCPNAEALKERFPYRIVRAQWAGKGGSTYPITLHVVGHDDLGIVNNITSIISKEQQIMLRSISIDSTDDGLFSGILTVMVKDSGVLTQLIKKLRTVKGVKAVSRG